MTENPEQVRAVLEGYAALGLALPMTDAAWIADLYENACARGRRNELGEKWQRDGELGENEWAEMEHLRS